jgi:hypothetical protein
MRYGHESALFRAFYERHPPVLQHVHPGHKRHTGARCESGKKISRRSSNLFLRTAIASFANQPKVGWGNQAVGTTLRLAGKRSRTQECPRTAAAFSLRSAARCHSLLPYKPNKSVLLSACRIREKYVYMRQFHRVRSTPKWLMLTYAQ